LQCGPMPEGEKLDKTRHDACINDLLNRRVALCSDVFCQKTAKHKTSATPEPRAKGSTETEAANHSNGTQTYRWKEACGTRAWPPLGPTQTNASESSLLRYQKTLCCHGINPKHKVIREHQYSERRGRANTCSLTSYKAWVISGRRAICREHQHLVRLHKTLESTH
jgi:hypothetical protein